MMLRDYQQKMIEGVRASLAKGNKAVCLTAPTGSGKTHVAAEIIEKAKDKGSNVLFLAPRRELVYQLCEKLDAARIVYGVIMAGESQSVYPQVQVASVSTLHARAIQRNKIELPPASVVIVDECHWGVGGRNQKIIEHYKNSGSIVIGLSATPATTSGKALGVLYDDLVLGPSVRELTNQGYLVPAKYFAGEKPDLDGIKVTAGDFNQKQLGERVNQPKLIGDVVTNWARIAQGRQTFVFAVNVAHSMSLREEFASIGVESEHIDGTTPLDERAEIMRRLKSGQIQVLVNVGVMTYGVDFPPVSCIAMACPTKSIIKYMQCIGRGLRTFDGKQDCYVLDHGGCVDNPDLGFVDDPRPWSLEGDTTVQERQQSAGKEAKPIDCPKCKAQFKAAKVCPNCGHEMGGRYKKAIEALEAELKEVKRDKSRKVENWDMRQKSNFFAELKRYGQEKGYKPGWAAMKYRERLGVWPNHPDIKHAPSRPVSLETQAWLKHSFIKWKKGQERDDRPRA